VVLPRSKESGQATLPEKSECGLLPMDAGQRGGSVLSRWWTLRTLAVRCNKIYPLCWLVVGLSVIRLPPGNVTTVYDGQESWMTVPVLLTRQWPRFPEQLFLLDPAGIK
jgi:hypothetical protein